MPTPQEVAEAVAALEADTAKEEPKAEPKQEPEPAKAEPEKAATPEPEEPKAEPKPAVRRKADLIPASKFHQTRHELQAKEKELEEWKAKVAALEASKSESKPQEDDEEVSKVAEKHGISKDVVKDIASLARPKAKPDAALEERLSRIEAERELLADAERYRNEESAVFEKSPELKAYAKDLRELAYTEGYEAVPLELLALKLKADLNLGAAPKPPEGASAPPAGKPRDLDALTDEDISKLSPADLDRFIAKNRLRR